MVTWFAHFSKSNVILYTFDIIAPIFRPNPFYNCPSLAIFLHLHLKCCLTALWALEFIYISYFYIFMPLCSAFSSTDIFIATRLWSVSTSASGRLWAFFTLFLYHCLMIMLSNWYLLLSAGFIHVYLLLLLCLNHVFAIINLVYFVCRMQPVFLHSHFAVPNWII